MLVGLGREVLAQDTEFGAIAGTITDSWQGRPIAGVVVTIRGTTLGSTSDVAGNYRLQQVPPGGRVLLFNKSGFARTTMENVKVAAGQTTRAEARLKPEFFEMETFEALADPLPEEQMEIIEARKESAVVVDALGEDYISQVGADDAAEAAAKVTGVTIQEGKFVTVRGLSDRYTSATMNGAEIPSADPEKQAAQLDLIPAEMIRRIEVRKTFMPDMPGGFAGGAVNIVTKSFPDKFVFNFSAGASYNANNNLRDDFAGSVQSSTDFFALDDGLRAYPDALQEVGDVLDSAGPTPIPGTAFVLDPDRRDLARLEDGGLTDGLWLALIGETGGARRGRILDDLEPLSQFGPVTSDSPLNHNGALTYGDTYQMFGWQSGFLAGFNYDRGYTMRQGRRITSHTFDAASGTYVVQKDATLTNGVAEATWGANFTTGVKPSANHELGFNFSRTQTADDSRTFVFALEPTGDTRRYESHYTERGMQNFQFFGKHELPEVADLKFEWTTSISSVGQDEPNHAQAMYLQDIPGNPFITGRTGISPTLPTRTWREIVEDNFNNRVDFDLPFTLFEELEGAISFGAYQSVSDRSYREDGVRFSPIDTKDTGNGNLPGANVGEIRFIEAVDYDGMRTIEAAYAMAEVPLGRFVKILGGARAESTAIEVDTREKLASATPPGDSEIRQRDLLPALGLVIEPTENTKVTVGWSRTIARPTFREIADVRITDFSNLEFVDGNPNLKMSAAENYDARVEWFPQPGEVISFGGFFKTIQNPIEKQSSSTDFPNFTFVNSAQATVYGLEAEYRRSLGTISDSLKNLTLGANAAWIVSEVENDALIIASKGVAGQMTRPLFDQSPLILNADLTYASERLGLESTLAFNYYGRRLVSVERTRPDIYEDPVATLDLSISKRFGKDKRWKLKFSAKNLLDPTISKSLDEDFAQLYPDGRAVSDSYRRGRSYGISLSYKF